MNESCEKLFAILSTDSPPDHDQMREPAPPVQGDLPRV
jgi:hypothetical protein